MLQELTSATGAQIWAIGSMLFFILVFALILLLVLRKNHQEMEHCSRLPLDDQPPMPREDAGRSALPGKQGQ